MEVSERFHVPAA